MLLLPLRSQTATPSELLLAKTTTTTGCTQHHSDERDSHCCCCCLPRFIILSPWSVIRARSLLHIRPPSTWSSWSYVVMNACAWLTCRGVSIRASPAFANMYWPQYMEHWWSRANNHRVTNTCLVVHATLYCYETNAPHLCIRLCVYYCYLKL